MRASASRVSASVALEASTTVMQRPPAKLPADTAVSFVGWQASSVPGSPKSFDAEMRTRLARLMIGEPEECAVIQVPCCEPDWLGLRVVEFERPLLRPV